MAKDTGKEAELTPDLLANVIGSKKRGRPATGKAKTPAQRMKEYRERLKGSEMPESRREAMIACYQQGYEDGAAGRPPKPPAGADLAMSYLCGGMDAK